MQASIQQHKVATSREKAQNVDSEDHSVYNACKYRKSIVSLRKRYAFPVENLQKLVATTFEVDERVKACALLLEDTELSTKLNTADMVALEANYHTRCLVSLYKCA